MNEKIIGNYVHKLNPREVFSVPHDSKETSTEDIMLKVIDVWRLKQMKILKMLLQYGANPDLKDIYERTAFEVAEVVNDKEILELLQIKQNANFKNFHLQHNSFFKAFEPLQSKQTETVDNIDKREEQKFTKNKGEKYAEDNENVQPTVLVTTPIQRLIQSNVIEPLSNGSIRVVFQSIQLAKEFQNELLEIGTENRDMQGAARKINVLRGSGGMEDSPECYAIELTKAEWEVLKPKPTLPPEQQPVTRLVEHSQDDNLVFQKSYCNLL